jgi:hypothetical protein
VLKPLPPDDLPTQMFTVAELAAAKAAGHLRIHDNGVLTMNRPGQPVVAVLTPAKVRGRKSASVDIPKCSRTVTLADPLADPGVRDPAREHCPTGKF